MCLPNVKLVHPHEVPFMASFLCPPLSGAGWVMLTLNSYYVYGEQYCWKAAALPIACNLLAQQLCPTHKQHCLL